MSRSTVAVIFSTDPLRSTSSAPSPIASDWRSRLRSLTSAQNFYGQSVGGLKSQVQNYREQLERFTQQLPEGDAKAQVQEMIDSYTELEGSMDQAAQDAGVEDAVNEAAQQTNQQMQQFAQEERPGRTRGRPSRSRRTPHRRPRTRPRNWAWTSPRLRVPGLRDA